MPTINERLLAYGPLALTLSTAIIDIALTTNTTSNSRNSQQGVQNFYKSIRKYNSTAITLASTWSSGYLTYLKLTDGTYTVISDLSKIVTENQKEIILSEPILLTGIALGVNGINIGARIFNQAFTNSQSSSKRINANKVFDILGDNIFPQLSGGLLVGVIGGAIAGAGKVVFNSTQPLLKILDPVLQLSGELSSDNIKSITDFASDITKQEGNNKSIFQNTIDSLSNLPVKNILNEITTSNGTESSSLSKLSTAISNTNTSDISTNIETLATRIT